LLTKSLVFCYYRAPLSLRLLKPDRRHRILWECGTLRCEHIVLRNPDSHTVYVFNGDQAMCLERCANADEAALIAERLRKLFTENPR